MLNPSQIVSRNIPAAMRFYSAAARPLGLTVIKSGDGFSIGQAGHGVMLRVTSNAADVSCLDDCPETRPAMVSLEANDQDCVKAFFREAIRAGGMDITYPSQQVDEHGRYAARVSDLDGNCIECVSSH